MASKGTTLTHRTGVRDKAIAYPTPYTGDLSPEEELTYVNPTRKVTAIVCKIIAPSLFDH